MHEGETSSLQTHQETSSTTQLFRSNLENRGLENRGAGKTDQLKEVSRRRLVVNNHLKTKEAHNIHTIRPPERRIAVNNTIDNAVTEP